MSMPQLQEPMDEPELFHPGEKPEAQTVGKAPGAYRTISEVAEELNVPQHVLRFWEAKFTQLKPLKRGGGRRYYRPEDTATLRQIHTLLYSQGYTIKGAQKVLKDDRVKPENGSGDSEPAAEMPATSERELLMDMLNELKALRALV